MIKGLVTDIIEAVKEDGTSWTDEEMMDEYTYQIKTGEYDTLVVYLTSIKRLDLVDRILIYEEMKENGNA